MWLPQVNRLTIFQEQYISLVCPMYSTYEANSLASLSLLLISNSDNLPTFGPTEFNLATVLDKQVRADEAIKGISAATEHFTSTQAGPVVFPAFDFSRPSLEMAKQLIGDVFPRK